MTESNKSSNQRSRPQPSPTVSRWDHQRALAVWAGIEWSPSSMHATAEDAIHRAADLLEEIERLRAALKHSIATTEMCSDILHQLEAKGVDIPRSLDKLWEVVTARNQADRETVRATDETDAEHE